MGEVHTLRSPDPLEIVVARCGRPTTVIGRVAAQKLDALTPFNASVVHAPLVNQSMGVGSDPRGAASF